MLAIARSNQIGSQLAHNKQMRAPVCGDARFRCYPRPFLPEHQPSICSRKMTNLAGFLQVYSFSKQRTCRPWQVRPNHPRQQAGSRLRSFVAPAQPVLPTPKIRTTPRQGSGTATVMQNWRKDKLQNHTPANRAQKATTTPS